ncbi:PEP-CTERM sorting domain-containing protein [Massilia sp. BJB1822]|uniref:PEP-CTERM sorting domain-containing protein n=1 Tax=Massilia sp. BJB1822 TaxID=2744470 RepID=UPI0015939BCC|nr:PEP-CTERM sorting domain-containing protein [Massilia sp. BJB1822]NVD97577.1 PEP-CTERM sorting domain-containing protein [Massilia sp. BJB1822]
MAAALPGQAAVINLSTSASSVAVGQSFNVDFRISGMSSAAGDSLSGFDLNVLFDSAAVQLTSFSFLDASGSLNQLDLSEAGSFGFLGDAQASGNSIDVFGLSGNSAAVLDTDQADAFRFLSLNFKALAPSAGTAIGLDLSDPNLLFTDSGAGSLPYTMNGDSVRLAIGQGAQVPEPGTLLLLLATLPALALLRRRTATALAVSAGLIATLPASAQQMAPAQASKEASAPFAKAGDTVSGQILEIKGQRAQIRLSNGSAQWVSLDTPISNLQVGAKISGKLVQGGDTLQLTNISISN